MRTYRHVLRAAAAFGALVAAHPVQAQEQGQLPESASEAGDTDIVVTARRREEKLQDVPIAVTAIGGDALDQRGFDGVTDVAQVAPNLQFTPGQGGNSGGVSAFIRGVGENDFIITSDPAVALYIDGVYVARSFGATTELLGIDRIEVLRGPQGSLFGKNTIGGAINVVSRIPDGNRVEGDIHYGSFNDLRLRLDAAYRSLTYIDVENTPILRAPDHAILNASAEFTLPARWPSLRLAVDNITDKRVLTAGYDASTSFGFVEGYFNDPRRYSVTLSFRR